MALFKMKDLKILDDDAIHSVYEPLFQKGISILNDFCTHEATRSTSLKLAYSCATIRQVGVGTMWCLLSSVFQVFAKGLVNMINRKKKSESADAST